VLPTISHPIILYDGVCGLCNRFVRFILKRDKRDAFRFASQQSEFAANILRGHGINPEQFDTVYLVLEHGQPTEQLLARSDAADEILSQLGGIWRLWAGTMRLFPHGLRNWIYNLIARRRYQMFGKYESCPLPDPKDRHKFLDLN
jgi:predicted DCC family thiol-disulfide oxidoreductase YuxK